MRWNVYEMEYTVPIRGCFSLVAGKRVLQDHVGAGNARARRSSTVPSIAPAVPVTCLFGPSALWSMGQHITPTNSMANAA